MVLDYKAEEILKNIFDQCKEEVEALERETECRAQFNHASDVRKYIFEDIEDLLISTQYDGNVLPPFKLLKSLKKFSCGLSLSWNVYDAIDMKNMEEMTITVTDDADIVINAPKLKKLKIMVHKDLKASSSRFILNFSNAALIEELYISYADNYDISSINNLKELKKLTIFYTVIDDYNWLSDCKKVEKLEISPYYSDLGKLPELPELKELTIKYSGIIKLYYLKYYPTLEILDLSCNKITYLCKNKKLENIKRVDLYNNPIANNKEDLSFLKDKKIILTKAESKAEEFSRDMNGIFKRAYYLVRSLYKKYDSLSAFMKRNLQTMNEIEVYSKEVERLFRELFYSLSFDNYHDGYTPLLKQRLLNYVAEHYPFINILDEYRLQIQNETLGIQYFYEKTPGRLIYLNRGVFVVNVKIVEGKFDPEIREIDNLYDSTLNTNEVKKAIKKYINEFDFDTNNVIIEYFDLYKTGNARGLITAVVVALKCLIENISVQDTVAMCGDLNNKLEVCKNYPLHSWIETLVNTNNLEKVIILSQNPAKKEIITNFKYIYSDSIENVIAVLRKLTAPMSRFSTS